MSAASADTGDESEMLDERTDRTSTCRTLSLSRHQTHTCVWVGERERGERDYMYTHATTNSNNSTLCLGFAFFAKCPFSFARLCISRKRRARRMCGVQMRLRKPAEMCLLLTHTQRDRGARAINLSE